MMHSNAFEKQFPKRLSESAPQFTASQDITDFPFAVSGEVERAGKVDC